MARRRPQHERVELPIIVEGGAAAPAPTAATPDEARPDPSRRSDAHILVAAAVVALVIVGVVAAVTDADDAERAAPTTLAPVLSPIAAAESEAFADRAGTALGRSRTTIGVIDWTRYDGDRELPARVDIDVDGGLVGIDDELGLLRPVDGASRWIRAETIERIVAGDLWRQRRLGGSPGLGIVTPIGRMTIELTDLVEPLPTGFVATVDPVLGPNDGFPIELQGQVFLLASTRVGLPWDRFANAAADGSYRVDLSSGERSVRLARGRFHELAVEEFTLTPGGGVLHHVLDAAGERVWSLEVGGAREPLEAAAGRFETSWLRWNGSRFVAAARPWPDWHDVDMVPVGRGVLARSDGPLHRDVELWFSTDGDAWQRVELPAERSERTPVGVYHDGDGAIVTLFAAGGPQAWWTDDGTTFERLPDVPGVAERHRSEIGWVAADPRSAPTLRLSADGRSWEELDIGSLLGLDAAGWDVMITAAPAEDRIVVVVDRPDGRSVLVGRVVPDRSG